MKGLCGLLVLLCGCQGEEHSWELVYSFSEEETVFLAVRERGLDAGTRYMILHLQRTNQAGTPRLYL